MESIESDRSEVSKVVSLPHSYMKLPPHDAMKISVSYEGARVTLDVCPDQTVTEIKDVVREIFNIGPDEGPSSAEMQDRKILSLSYAGSNLGNKWTLKDLGIHTGSSLKAVLVEDVQPSLYVFCGFNGDTIKLFDKINTFKTDIGEFRGIVSRKSGLPVGAFRLLNKVEDGIEMFDARTLEDYNVEPGQSVRLETWDGWNDLLNLAIMGFTSHVMSYLSSDEVIARYQMKVALYVAAHFGHVDLAISLVKQGIRADEAIGEHPMRQWCKNATPHLDIMKTPIHEASESGQLGVLRAFVHQNISNILAKDGKDLTPLNIALRTKQKACASFLLTKQWHKINYTKKSSIPLSIYVKMKRWSEQAKEKVLMIHGQWKSSMKHPKRFIQSGALLGYGVLLDGYSKSKLMSKPVIMVKMEEEEEERKNKPIFDIADEERRMRESTPPGAYFKQLKHAGHKVKLPKVNRHVKLVSKPSSEIKHEVNEALVDDSETESNVSPETKRKYRPRSSSESRADGNVRLPPINEKLGKKSRNVSMSHQNLTTGNKTEPEFKTSNNKGSTSQGVYLKTPGVGKNEGTPSVPESTRIMKRESQEGNNDQISDNQKRASRSVKSLMMAKARTDGTLALPLSSVENCPRPFMRSEHITKGTLELYERHRGLKSRDYAIRCMSIGNTFKEKPWLQQIHQAMIISKQGVKNTFNREPHMFHGEGEMSALESSRSEMIPSIATTRESTTRSSNAVSVP